MTIQLKLLLTILILYCSFGYSAPELTAENVFVHEEEDFVLHVATYSFDLKVLSMLKGEYKGLQEIWSNDICVEKSYDVEFNEDFFVHFYPDFFVYSTSEFQYIQFIGSPKDIKCSAPKKDSAKSSKSSRK